MTQRTLRCAAVVAGLLCAAPSLQAQYNRRTAIVEAVDKTRHGIVTLKVVKATDYGKKNVVGTGVIVDERGYVVTNHHVVDSASKITATLSDKTALDVTVHLELPGHDLAILKLSNPKKKRLTALPFGPGSDLLVGETVIAVGNPYGYTNTVSTGIISALGREIKMPSDHTLSDLIQHNAAINPGNSGGPLLNINGEVIGINVALRDGAQGIGFAINADTVKDVLRRHLSASKMSKVTHGLKTEEKVESKGKQRQKVVVASAPGDEVKKGDVIVTVGSLKVANRFDLERALWGYKAGEKVELSVLREGKQVKASLTLSGTTEVADSRRGR
jgi:serine protease Do